MTEPDATDLPLKRRLFGGRYRIEAPIGRGAMGAVYRARHVLTDRIVALKCIQPGLAQRDILIRRFRAEASISAHVNHPGLVKMFDAGEEEDGTLYLAMELLVGDTLSTRAKRDDFTVRYGLDVVRSALEPLAAVHAAGIVHRDIKPEHIFVHRASDGSEQVKLLDFGIARDPRSQSSTAADLGMGTPYYMSPEQATSAREVTAASDIWSVGVILYWLLSGRLPFADDTAFATLTLACSQPHPAIDASGSATMGRLVSLVDRTLEKQPEHRPQDALSLLAELNDILGSSSGEFIRRPAVVPSVGIVSDTTSSARAREAVAMVAPAAGVRSFMAGLIALAGVATAIGLAVLFTGRSPVTSEIIDAGVPLRAPVSAAEPTVARPPETEPPKVSAPAERPAPPEKRKRRRRRRARSSQPKREASAAPVRDRVKTLSRSSVRPLRPTPQLSVRDSSAVDAGEPASTRQAVDMAGASPVGPVDAGTRPSSSGRAANDAGVRPSPPKRKKKKEEPRFLTF